MALFYNTMFIIVKIIANAAVFVLYPIILFTIFIPTFSIFFSSLILFLLSLRFLITLYCRSAYNSNMCFLYFPQIVFVLTNKKRYNFLLLYLNNNMSFSLFYFWRRWRDLNPRCPYEH